MKKYLGIAVMGSLTLGLAPFVPEPHIWGKLKWVAGGANGMEAMDWFDFFFHGAPWIFLLVVLGSMAINKFKS